MKLFILASLFVSSIAFAEPCDKKIKAAVNELEPGNNISSVTHKGILNPGEERPYYQGEIWNETQVPLDIYEVKSGFMGIGTIHVALVNKVGCKVENVIEVSFDD